METTYNEEKVQEQPKQKPKRGAAIKLTEKNLLALQGRNVPRNKTHVQ